MSAAAALLPGGRLHLQHGPIDAIVQAWGEPAEVRAAYAQVVAAFPDILPRLCAELSLLRSPLPAPKPQGPVAARMHAACAPFASGFITPMAAVAGAVADHLLAALSEGRRLDRALGDIAIRLCPGRSFRCGIVADLAAPGLDAIATIGAADGVGGIATSGRRCKGRGGRSFSFGIADAVTVLAADAASADAAATVIANAVDLPGHPAIERRPAAVIDPDSDLGDRPVTWDVGPLLRQEIARALAAGAAVAEECHARGLIRAAILHLRGERAVVGAPSLALAA
jgi:ApbE superfamily uncharacterized protein (UPF0280 family)